MVTRDSQAFSGTPASPQCHQGERPLCGLWANLQGKGGVHLEVDQANDVNCKQGRWPDPPKWKQYRKPLMPVHKWTQLQCLWSTRCSSYAPTFYLRKLDAQGTMSIKSRLTVNPGRAYTVISMLRSTTSPGWHSWDAWCSIYSPCSIMTQQKQNVSTSVMDWRSPIGFQSINLPTRSSSLTATWTYDLVFVIPTMWQNDNGSETIWWHGACESHTWNGLKTLARSVPQSVSKLLGVLEHIE